MKIYSAVYGTGAGDAYPFDSFLEDEKELTPVSVPKQLENPDGFLIIWGGADIHPSFYNMPNHGSYVGGVPSLTDKAEWALIQKAFDIGMPVLGVCRGAQMGCAFSHGKLAQDVDNHGFDHEIYLKGVTDTPVTSSVHHQMMYPFSVEHELIGWAKSLSQHYSGLTEKEVDTLAGIEPEIVYFPQTKILSVQGHPEFMSVDAPFNDVVRELIQVYLFPHVK